MISPQLRALGPEARILSALIDAFIAGCIYVDEAWDHRLVKTAIIVESGKSEGWNEDRATRVMASRGWKGAEGIYDAAGIPDKHRRVIDLALWQAGSPDKNRKGYFTLQQIADMTGHPLRTVKLWIHDDLPKLARLDWEDAA